MKKEKKEITNENLAKLIDDLAMMIQRGFIDLEERLTKRMDNRFDKVESRLDKVEDRLDKVEQTLIIVVREQEDLKLRQDNAAYRFELRDLTERVEVLERKNDIFVRDKGSKKSGSEYSAKKK